MILRPLSRNITQRPSFWHSTQQTIHAQTDLPGTDGGDSCGNSVSLETSQELGFFRGGSSHARGKRPPVVKGNVVINNEIFVNL